MFVRTFCLIHSLKTGCVVFAITGLVLATVVFVSGLFSSRKYQNYLLAEGVILVVQSFILLLGTHLRIPKLLLLWVALNLITFLLSITVDVKEAIDLIKQGRTLTFGLFAATYPLYIAIFVYSFVTVISFYHEIKIDPKKSDEISSQRHSMDHAEKTRF